MKMYTEEQMARLAAERDEAKKYAESLRAKATDLEAKVVSLESLVDTPLGELKVPPKVLHLARELHTAKVKLRGVPLPSQDAEYLHLISEATKCLGAAGAFAYQAEEDNNNGAFLHAEMNAYASVLVCLSLARKLAKANGDQNDLRAATHTSEIHEPNLDDVLQEVDPVTHVPVESD